MRLAIISDIHANQLALEAILIDLQAAGEPDKTWVLGDLCAFGPRPAECLQMIRDLKETQVISGNTDRYILTGERPRMRGPIKEEAEWQKIPEQLMTRELNLSWCASRLSFADYEYLGKLHHELDLEVLGYGYAIGYHAAPDDDEVIMQADTPDEEVLDQMADREGRLGFGGHTHLPMDRDLGLWRVINVGSVGMPFDEARACYVIATFENGTVNIEFRRVEYDIDAVIADLKESGNAGWEWAAARQKPY